MNFEVSSNLKGYLANGIPILIMTSPLQKTRTTLIGPLILNWQLLKRPIYIHKIESVYFSNLGSRNLSLGLYHWNFSYKMSTICLEGSFSRVSHLLKML